MLHKGVCACVCVCVCTCVCMQECAYVCLSVCLSMIRMYLPMLHACPSQTCDVDMCHAVVQNIHCTVDFTLSCPHTHTLQHDLVAELQGALDYLWEASRYEVMGEVAKLLLPFYEEEREYEVMAMGDSP